VGGSNLPWWIAGAALFGLILVVGWSMVQPAGPSQQQPAQGASAGGPAGAMGAATTDISQMTPIEAANRLYNRVMTTVSEGDTANALAFQPMAIQAYERAEPLSLDAIYHMALLEMINDPSAALASAQRILEEDPNHILALGVAAKASLALGDDGQATEYYQTLLDGYDEEVARDLEEYQAHSNLVTEYRADALNYLNGGG
jgi:hypothetical protein